MTVPTELTPSAIAGAIARLQLVRAPQVVRPVVTPTVVVELVGPAGAGKSTVRALACAALGAPDATVRRTRLRTVALASRHAGAWLPPAAALLLASPRVGRELLRHLVRVQTLAAELPRLRAAAGGAVLLDEGPVLSLALISRTIETTGAPALARYLRAVLPIWGAALDMIVWLDAPDAVLGRRINERAKAHRVKGRSDAELRDFLAWYRRHYTHVVEELADRGVRVVRIDTALDGAHAVAARVAALARTVSRAR